MTTTATPGEVADQVAEAVRTLNHLTMNSMRYPSDVYDVTGGLTTAASRLPQLFAQLGTWLEREAAASRVAHDSGQDPGEYVTAVTDALHRASQDAETLTAALDSAHEACGGLKAA